MRLTVPEPKIDLYNDGFEPGRLDQLGRKETGDKLSDLVERIDDPLVIALDGAWGSGKSFFLKCWVGEHKNHNANTQTVYFDAFKHDFLDDPLIALTDAIATRFEKDERLAPAESANRVEKLKKLGWVLGKSSAKIGVSVAGHYAKKLVGEECLEEFGKELEKASDKGVATLEDEVKTLIDSDIGKDESETFWREQRAKIVAMAAFREALMELTEPNKEGEPQRKLVIVVDELDRCRPDYALSLLEIIKHFFNVGRVHFVLGVNLEELQNSVRARYGSGVDAAKYLQKFISLTAPLKGPKPRNGNFSSFTKHFDTVAIELGFSHSWQYDWVKDYLKIVSHHYALNLREIEKLGTLLQICPTSYLNSDGQLHLFAGLSILSISAPNSFEKARFGELTFDEVASVFEFPTVRKFENHMEDAAVTWRLASKYDPDTHMPMMYQDQSGRLFQKKPSRTEAANIIANCFDTFIVPDH